jgi:hypothetical protein
LNRSAQKSGRIHVTAEVSFPFWFTGKRGVGRRRTRKVFTTYRTVAGGRVGKCVAGVRDCAHIKIMSAEREIRLFPPPFPGAGKRKFHLTATITCIQRQ